MSDYTSMAIPPSGKKRVDMNKEILRLAIPNIISNFGFLRMGTMGGMAQAYGMFLGLVFSVGQYCGNHGLWLSLLLFMIMRGLVQGILFRSGAWDLR